MLSAFSRSCIMLLLTGISLGRRKYWHRKTWPQKTTLYPLRVQTFPYRYILRNGDGSHSCLSCLMILLRWSLFRVAICVRSMSFSGLDLSEVHFGSLQGKKCV